MTVLPYLRLQASSSTAHQKCYQKTITSYLVKQLRKFHRNGSFITVFTKAHRRISSTSNWIEARHTVRKKSIKRSKTSFNVGGYVPKDRNIGPDNAECSRIFPHYNQNFRQSVNNFIELAMREPIRNKPPSSHICNTDLHDWGFPRCPPCLGDHPYSVLTA